MGGHRDAAQTGLDSICQQALDHYMALSNACCDYNSTVVYAIEFYKKYGKEIVLKKYGKVVSKVARTKNINRVNAPIGITVMLNKRVTRLMYDLQIEEPDLDNNLDEFMSNLKQATAYIKKAQTLVTEKAL